jgi:hypothetical protein
MWYRFKHLNFNFISHNMILGSSPLAIGLPFLLYVKWHHCQQNRHIYFWKGLNTFHLSWM